MATLVVAVETVVVVVVHSSSVRIVAFLLFFCPSRALDVCHAAALPGVKLHFHSHLEQASRHGLPYPGLLPSHMYR